MNLIFFKKGLKSLISILKSRRQRTNSGKSINQKTASSSNNETNSLENRTQFADRAKNIGKFVWKNKKQILAIGGFFVSLIGLSADDVPDADGMELDDGDSFDLDGDGIEETLAIDTDGDGIVDTFASDIDGDGIVDQMLVDSDGDGIFDSQIMDFDHDGKMDCVLEDADGDGILETSRDFGMKDMQKFQRQGATAAERMFNKHFNK